MLIITIPENDLWDEQTNRFIHINEQTIRLEHSLVSLSKWESKWCKPFLSSIDERTNEELLDYIKCMTLTQNVNPNVYYGLTVENIKQINDYIHAPMTATTFSDNNNKKQNSQKLTSEVIYYLMIAFNIPFECQKWHLNRLITLIRVCDVKSSPGKKMSKADVLRQQAELNAKRRKQLNSKG